MSSADSSLLQKDEEGVRMPWTPERWDFVIALGFRVGESTHERGNKVAAGTVAFWCMVYLLVGCVVPVLPIVEEALGGGERQSLVLSGAHGAGMLCVVVGMAHYVSTTSAHLLSVLLTISPIVTSASLTFLLKGQAPFHLLAFAAPPVAMATGLPDFSPLALAAVVLLLFAPSVYAEQNPASPSVEEQPWDRVAVYTAQFWFGALPFFLGTLLSMYFLCRRPVAPSRHLNRFIHTFLAEQSRGPKVVEAAAAAAAAAAASPQASPQAKSDAASVASTAGGAPEAVVSLYEAEEGRRGYTCGRVLGGTLRATVCVLLVLVLAAAGGSATYLLARHFHREESSRHALAHRYSASSSDMVTDTVMQRLLALLRELPAETVEEELHKPSPPLPVIRLQIPYLPFHLMSFGVYERRYRQAPDEFQAHYFPSWASNVLASEVVTAVNAGANTSVPLSHLVANATRMTVAFDRSLWEWRSAHNKNDTSPPPETDAPATPIPIEIPPGVISTSGPVPANGQGPVNEERVTTPSPWTSPPWTNPPSPTPRPTPSPTPADPTLGTELTGEHLEYGSDLARLVGYAGLSKAYSLYEEAMAGELPPCQAPAWARGGGGGRSDHSAGEMLQNHPFSLHLVQLAGAEPMLAMGCILTPDAAATAAADETSVQRAAGVLSNVTRGPRPAPGTTGSVTSVKNTTRGHIDSVQLVVLAVSASSLLPDKKAGFLVSTNLSLAGTSDAGGPTLHPVVEKEGGSLGLGMAISFVTRIPFGSKGSELLLTTAMDHDDLWRPLMGDLEVSLLALWLTVLAAMLAAVVIVWAGFRPISELAQTAKVYACGDLPLEELTLHTMRFKELVYLKWSLYRLANAVLGARQLVPPGAIDLLTGNHGDEGEEDSWMDLPVSASPDGCDAAGEYVGGSFCFETPPSHPEQDPSPPVAASGAITDSTTAGAQAAAGAAASAASTTVGGNGGSGKGRTASPDTNNGRPNPAYEKADDGMVSTPSLSAVSMPALDPVARRGSQDTRRHPLRAPGSPSGATPGSDDLPNAGPSSHTQHWHEMSPRLDKSGTPLQLLQTRRVAEVEGGGGGGSGGGDDGQPQASSSSAVHSPEGASSPHTFSSPRPGGSSSDLLQGSVVPGAGRMYGGGAGAGAGTADAADASVRSLGGRRKLSIFGPGAAATSPQQGDVEAGSGGAAAAPPRKKSVRFDLGLSAHRLQTAEAAVMALNMVGLFPLWRVGKEVVIRQFYTVFSAALTTVSSCQGVTVSIVGDRLLALWRSDRTARACDAALRIQAACAEGSRTDGLLASGAQSPAAVKLRGDHPARVRISLSGGRVIWGNFSLCQEEGRPCAVLNAFGQPINRAAAVERFSRRVDTFTAVDSWVYNRMALSQPALWTRPVAMVAYRFAPSVSKRPYPSAIYELLPALSDSGHGWSLFAELSYEHDTSIADYAPGAEGGKAHARAFAAACAGEWAEAETLLKGAVVPVNIHVSRLLQTVLERKPPVELEA